nr:MAG TPA: hypothetical protein [Caudoviricetes sp.]DAV64429.1 MAG TPA: hypothetical protein [Caudoviricetes sp.]
MHVARWNLWNGCRRAHRKGLFERGPFLCYNMIIYHRQRAMSFLVALFYVC